MKNIISLFGKVTAVLFVSLLSATLLTALAGHVDYAPLVAVPIFALPLVTNYKLPMLAFSSPTVFTEGICEDIQESLINLMGNNSPSLKRTPVGYLQAVKSASNMAGVRQMPIPSDGKKRKVRIVFDQRATDTGITDSIGSSCDGDVVDTPFETDFEVEQEVSSPGIIFSEDEMRKLCQTDKSWIAQRLNARFDAMAVYINKKLITLQNSTFGKFKDGTSTVHSRQLLVAATKSAFYYGENQILNDFTDISATGRPILIGNGKLRDYTRIQSKGCCNASGIDLGMAGEFDYYQDQHVGTILGNADDFIGLAPGNVQFASWNKYVGSYEKLWDSVIKTTMMDPYTGLVYDLTWKYDDCEENWILKLSLHYDLFFLPSNAFNASDPLTGVNYTLHYRATEA